MLRSAVFIVPRTYKFDGDLECCCAIHRMIKVNLARLRAADLAGFEQVNRLAENLTKIGTVDFIDDDR